MNSELLRRPTVEVLGLLEADGPAIRRARRVRAVTRAVAGALAWPFARLVPGRKRPRRRAEQMAVHQTLNRWKP